MIPEKLIIKGIYSYINRTEIDFSSLIEAGLFGIFGAVGSGKSTILEAITYALYGETERLNNRDSKAYNMMNLRSGEMEIDFVFRQNTERYRFCVYAKRNGKQFDLISKSERKAYKWVSNVWQPLESADATNVIGLKYEHFKQIVIIPQGKFNEFVQLSPQQRTDMLKELFPQMERFDLKDSVRLLHVEVKTQLSTLQGQLHELEEYTQEAVNLVKEEIVLKQNLLAKSKTSFENATKHINELVSIRKMTDEFAETQKRIETLEKQKPHFNLLENEIKQFEGFRVRYQPLLERMSETSKQLVDLQKHIDFQNKNILNLKITYAQAKADFEELLVRGGNVDAYKLRLAGLLKAMEVKEIQHKLGDQLKYLDTQAALYASMEHELNKKQELLRGYKNKLQKLKSSLPDEGLLHALQNSFHEEKHHLEGIKLAQKELDGVKILVNDLAIEKVEVIGKLHYDKQQSEELKKLNISKLVFELEQVELDKKKSIDTLRQQIESLVEQHSLAKFAAQLNDGKPCPLCGADHHPHPYSGDAQNEVQTEYKRQIRKLEEEREEVRAAIVRLNGLINRYKNEQGHQKEREAMLSNAQLALKRCLELRNELPINYTHEALEKEFRRLNVDKVEIQKLEKLIFEIETQLNDVTKIEVLRDDIQKIKTNISAFEAQIEVQIKDVDKDWLSLSVEALKQLRDATSTDIKKMEGLSSSIEKQGNELVKSVADVESYERQSKELRNEMTSKESDIQQMLRTDNISDIQIVKDVLREKLDVEKLRSEIANYQQELYALHNGLEGLQKKLKNKKFDPDLFVRLEKEVDQKKEEISNLENTLGGLENRLMLLESKLKVKAGYILDLDKCEKRKSNLDVLSTLFRGDGFIKFVSQVYLEQLCSMANERFKVLTNSRLELEVNEMQQFIVRDFLNEGKTRLLKTLSGGQTFQAAFSLAMALSEQIQLHQHVKQQFFFMDEGFGSLDKESLSLVFDTLKQLRLENRTVGIISHVEELQSEINRYLLIRNHDEEGSQIELNA